MPFKIIQTKERGKFILSIIPDKWEQNRILHWPKRRVEDLLEQESSCPDDSWLTMKCLVKRSGLISKQSAEAELANMLQESDTETEGSTQLTSNAKLINVAQHNFDEIASTCRETVQDKTFEAPPIEDESINNEQANSVVYEYITDIPQTSEQNVTSQVQNENSQNTEAISNILEITGALQQNQHIILDYIKSMEDKILRKLSFLSAQVDTIAERNVMLQAGKNVENVAFKIISNKEDLHNFEKLLENPKYRSDIKNQLSCVCGKGKGRGISNAYSLADAMFTRHFMTLCSWGGGSKKEISKLCFKSYTNTVELFFSVIHESDADYTKKENETFFKNIMRHSVSRNKQNIQRAASSRRRSQKQSKQPTALLAPTANNNGSSTIITNNIVASNQPSPTVDNSGSSTNNTSIVASTQPASATDSNGSSTDPTSSIVASTQPTAPSEDNNSFITDNNKTSSTVQSSLSAVPAAAIVDETLPRDMSLNAYIRYVLCLPGTKAMCREGGCGSCIVMVRAKRSTSGEIETFSVNSCLVLVFSCHGWEITTIEGVGNRIEGYSEAQKRIVKFNGTQCGYCTPGFVMHLTSLQHKNLTMAELEKSFGSNTCRCTGFRPIMDTIKSFASDVSPELCQKLLDIEELSICSKKNARKCSGMSDCSDWSIVEGVKDDNIIELDFGKYKFFKVFNVEDIFEVLKKHGVDSYMFVDGNTGKGIVETFEYPETLIDISEVSSLKAYEFDQNLILGANVSLQDCITLFKDTAKNKTEFSYLDGFVKHLELVAHIPVRKIGSLAGNLMYKKAVPTYQSDLFLLLECVGARITVRNMDGETSTLTLTEFLSYDMKGKLIINIELPPLSGSHVFRSYKIMPRNQNALAIVNAAFLIQRGIKGITSAKIVYGNIDPKFIHAKRTEMLKDVYTNAGLQTALKTLVSEVNPVAISGEPSIACRKKLALGLFYKFILNTCPTKISSKYMSGANLFNRAVSEGKQDYQTDPSIYPLNQPVSKLEAVIQSSGEARYTNDLPKQPREVFGAFVLSSVHSGEVDTIDIDHIMAIEGVVALYTAKDIPGVNSFTYPGIQLQTEDEEMLATKILFYGQPIAIIVAISEELASRVAKLVKVTYKNVSSSKPVLTIDDAKKDSKRYIAGDSTITPTSKGDDVKKVIKGVFDMEAQYHYYLEPITCVVVPVDNTLEVHDSSQWMDLTQIAVARSLGISESDVVVKVRRVGGAFGGKISRNVQASTACALVAKKLGVTCRFILPIQTNLTTAGRRLPCQCEYEVGVDDNGKIQYLNATMIEDNGCSSNENILSYAIGGFPNCYSTDTWTVNTAIVLTDLPSNSFARAPGTCEGITCIEHIMEHIAFAVKKDATAVREANMRTDDNDLPELINVLKSDSNYDKRAKDIVNYNKANRWFKKAISINVMSFPVEFYGNYSAFISIYRGDGTVNISTGGIEMGQGLNTKAAQVCAYKLGIPLEYVKILPSFSFVSSNNVFSGSSITTESVCYSIIKACEIIKARLEYIYKANPEATWKEVIKKAGDDQVDLNAEYMMADTDENLKGYSAFSVAILETTLDVLTGRFQIDRVDILEDVGVSANPKLDVGQVEGAYIQGLGYFTCEKFLYNKDTGKLLTNRSLTYHVPLCLDIPVEFNVKLRYNYKNPYGVLGSKTCGEMGICIAHGITHALRSCIMESRKDSGYDVNEWIYIPVPYTTEAILKALDTKPEEFLIV